MRLPIRWLGWESARPKLGRRGTGQDWESILRPAFLLGEETGLVLDLSWTG